MEAPAHEHSAANSKRWAWLAVLCVFLAFAYAQA
jgi:hypothetical protein